MPEADISVVLIAHNEEKVIGAMIDRLLCGYDKRIMELIVVDDASSDSTARIVEAHSGVNKKVKLVKRARPCGVGRAIKTGFNSVDPKSRFVLTMDSDFIESVDDVKHLINEIENSGCDGVIGSRFVKGSCVKLYPKSKLIMNRLYHYLVSFLFHIKQKDLTNNFKFFKTEIVKNMPWRSNGFSINAETGILPIIHGYRIHEVPVSWIGRSANMGHSKFRLFSIGWVYIKVIPYAIWVSLSKKRRSGQNG